MDTKSAEHLSPCKRNSRGLKITSNLLKQPLEVNKFLKVGLRALRYARILQDAKFFVGRRWYFFYIFQAFWLHQDVTSVTACGPKMNMHCPPSKPIVRNVITKDRIVKILTFFANRFVTSVNYLWQTKKRIRKFSECKFLHLFAVRLENTSCQHKD